MINESSDRELIIAIYNRQDKQDARILNFYEEFKEFRTETRHEFEKIHMEQKFLEERFSLILWVIGIVFVVFTMFITYLSTHNQSQTQPETKSEPAPAPVPERYGYNIQDLREMAKYQEELETIIKNRKAEYQSQ